MNSNLSHSFWVLGPLRKKRSRFKRRGKDRDKRVRKTGGRQAVLSWPLTCALPFPGEGTCRPTARSQASFLDLVPPPPPSACEPFRPPHQPHRPHCPGCLGLVGSGASQPRLLLPLPELPAVSLPSSPLSRTGLLFSLLTLSLSLCPLSSLPHPNVSTGRRLTDSQAFESVSRVCLTHTYT